MDQKNGVSYLPVTETWVSIDIYELKSAFWQVGVFQAIFDISLTIPWTNFEDN